jgi:6-pyruvoyltetrahydropterin/6-carboxytetrahydropterin synthase
MEGVINMRICKIFEWEAGHHLNLIYPSKCKVAHGHSYKILVEVEGPINKDGMVIDFAILKKWVEHASFDHSYINNDIDYFNNKNPTAENLVCYIKDVMDKPKIREHYKIPKNIKIRRIRVRETSKSFAEEVWK